MDFLDTLIGRPNTIKTYKSLYKIHIEPYSCWHHEEWTEQDVISYIKKWREEHNISSGTIKTLTMLLCRYIEWKTGNKISVKHTLKTVSRQQQENVIEVPSKPILYSLLDHAKDTDKSLYYPMVIALFSGMRKGEVMGLRWGDIDFKRNLITIRRSYDGPTKNGKTRLIPLHPRLQSELPDIFPKNCDNYLENKVISEQFDPNKNLQKLCKRRKIKAFTFHTLRHCFASYGLESGIDFNKIQKILGHSNLSTTVNFYWSSKYKPEDIDLTFI